MFWKRDQSPPLSARQRVDLELLLRRTAEIIGRDFIQTATWVTDLSQLGLDHENRRSLVESTRLAILNRLPRCEANPTVRVISRESLDQLSDYRPAKSAESPQHGSPVEVSVEAPASQTAATIEISDELIDDPLRLTMELASQHALHFWHQVSPQHPLDLTPLTTQLLPICCGLGFLASDASLYDSQWSLVGYSGWTLSRSGYYTAQEIGYALATLSSLKIDLPSNWIDRLRPDSGQIAKRVLSLYQKKDECKTLFNAEVIPSSKCSAERLNQWVEGDSPDFALAAMEALWLQNRPLDAIESSVLERSRDKDPSVAHAATKLLGRLTRPSLSCERRLGELIHHRDLAIAIEAIHASVASGINLEPQAKRISKILERAGAYGIELLETLAISKSSIPMIVPVLCRQLSQAVKQQASSDSLSGEMENQTPSADKDADFKSLEAWTRQLTRCLQNHSPDPILAISQHCQNASEIKPLFHRPE